jgi:hypothetical protein
MAVFWVISSCIMVKFTDVLEVLAAAIIRAMKKPRASLKTKGVSIMTTNRLKTGAESIPETSCVSNTHQTMYSL